MFPQEVEVNEKLIQKLISIYTGAYDQISKEILSSTSFGTYRRKQLLNQIEKILSDLGKDVGELVKEEIPAQYKSGFEQVGKQLNQIGAEINVKRDFSNIHQDAVKALVDDTSSAMYEAITGVKRSATRLLNTVTQNLITQKLAEGTISGKVLKDVKKDIVGILKTEGLDALIDSSGRGWKLDRYAEMLIRTKSVEARNSGLANRMVENGYDLVQVSNHGTDHQACAEWEGKILSLTGNTDGYKTVADATSAGLFHPNCKHAINVIVSDLAKQTKAYDFKTRNYS